jgi:hypothetical protein
MNPEDLPIGPHPDALEFPHFPTRHQAVVWRNWELVSPDRLAAVLETSAENILETAAGMGLPMPPVVGEHWLSRGYLTLIRANWHLLPYGQLLVLLGWSADKLEYTLKEDDFLWHKLGDLKPRCEHVRWRPLSQEEAARTEQLRQTVEKHGPATECDAGQPPFAFLADLATTDTSAEPPSREPFDELRLIYSYSAVYGDPLLDIGLDPYPDGLLARLVPLGVNAVWLQGILYTLVPFDDDPTWSAGHEQRLENLRALTERAARHGVGVYLYLNEPRGMPERFFDQHPEWRGERDPSGEMYCLCTSHPPVLEYLRHACAELFRQVPELAGVFTISISENATNCHSKGGGTPRRCPRCAGRPTEEIVAEVNSAIEEGVHNAKPDARVVVWTWAWREPWSLKAIDLLPVGVELMCTSEEAMPLKVGGVDVKLRDYSISQVGPGQWALGQWERARRRGLKTAAKVQFNNTWECSAVPYMPTFQLVERHIRNLREAGVDGIMLSWTTGGYPSPNLQLLGMSVVELAVSHYGREVAGDVLRACQALSNAFTEFPFSIYVVYHGPMNYGPKNLLYAEPTGYSASMLGFPYDDLPGWSDVYPEEIFEDQLRKLTMGWKQGLDILDQTEGAVATEKRPAFDELRRMARAAYCHFRSTYLQTAFIRVRNRNDTDSLERIGAILDEELELAIVLCRLKGEDARIGFEASNHYYYTRNDLMEKILNVEHLKRVR